MSAKAGLKEFGEQSTVSIMKELEQLLYHKVIVGHKASSLSSSQWKAALQYLVIKCIFDRLLSKYNRLDLSKVITNENYVKIIVIRAIPVIFLFLVPS